MKFKRGAALEKEFIVLPKSVDKKPSRCTVVSLRLPQEL